MSVATDILLNINAVTSGTADVNAITKGISQLTAETTALNGRVNATGPQLEEMRDKLLAAARGFAVGSQEATALTRAAGQVQQQLNLLTRAEDQAAAAARKHAEDLRRAAEAAARQAQQQAQANSVTARAGQAAQDAAAGMQTLKTALYAVIGSEIVQGLRSIWMEMRKLADEANQAQTDVKVFELTMKTFNVSIDSASAVAERLADRFGTSIESVKGSMTTLVRAGFRDMSQLERVMTGAGASMIAKTGQLGNAFDLLGDAAVTGLSAALNSMGIAENLGPAMDRYAKSLGKTADELGELERAQVVANLVLKATSTEVGALDTILNDYTRAQAESRRELTELRKEAGEMFKPIVQALTAEMTIGVREARAWGKANKEDLAGGLRAAAIAAVDFGGAVKVLLGFIGDLAVGTGGLVTILLGLPVAIAGGVVGAVRAAVNEMHLIFQTGVEGMAALQKAWGQLKAGDIDGALATVGNAKQRVVKALREAPTNVWNGYAQGSALGTGLMVEGANDLASFGRRTTGAAASADAGSTRVRDAVDGLVKGSEVIDALGMVGRSQGAAFGSRYSFKKKDGKTYTGTHNGVDFFAPRGTAVTAPVTGMLSLHEDEKNGKYFEIVDALGNRIKGLHLDAFEKGLQEAVKAAGGKLLVEQGTKIGGVGDTGNLSEGNHLHLMVVDAVGKSLNPLTTALKSMSSTGAWNGAPGAPPPSTTGTGSKDEKETPLQKEQRIRAEQVATEKLTVAIRNASKARLEAIIAGGVQKEGDLQRINLAEKELERRGQLNEKAAQQAKAAREKAAKDEEAEAKRAAQEAERRAKEQARVQAQLAADLRAGRVREAELAADKAAELNRQELAAFKGTAIERLALVRKRSQQEFDAAEQVARIKRNNAIGDAERGPAQLRQQRIDTANLEYQNTVLKLRGDRLDAVRTAQEGVTRAQQEAAEKARQAITEQARAEQQAYRDRRDSAMESIQNLSASGLNALYDEARANRDQALLKAFYDEVDRRTALAKKEVADLWASLEEAAKDAGMTLDNLRDPPDWMRDTLSSSGRTPLRDLLMNPQDFAALANSGDFPDLPGMLLSTYTGGDWAQLGTDFLQGLVEGLSGNAAWDAVTAVIRGELDLKEEVTALVNGAAMEVGNGFRTGNERPAGDALGDAPGGMPDYVESLRALDDVALAAQLAFAQSVKDGEAVNAVLAEMKRRADAVNAALNEQRSFDAAIQLQTWTESLQGLTDAQLEDNLQTAIAGRNLSEYNAIRAEQKRRVDEAAQAEKVAADAAAQTAKTFEALKARVNAIGQAGRPYADLIADLEKLRAETGANVDEIDALIARLRVLQGKDEGLAKFNEYARYVQQLAGAFGQLGQAVGGDLGANISGIANAASKVADMGMDVARLVASSGADIGAWISLGTKLISTFADMISGWQQAKRAAEDARKSFQDAFKFIDAGQFSSFSLRSRGFWADLFGGGPEVVQQVNEVAASIARTIESGVAGAFQTGIKRFLNGEGDILTALREGLRDTVINAVTEAIVQGAVIKGALGKLLTDLTLAAEQQNWARVGQITGEIGGALPALASNLQTALSPLIGSLNGALGSNTAALQQNTQALQAAQFETTTVVSYGQGPRQGRLRARLGGWGA